MTDSDPTDSDPTDSDMTDKDAEIEASIRTYLENHGGSVEDAGGRGLTDELAKEIGVDKPMLVSATLARMEGDGVVTREVRGLRTYRIALGAGDGSVPAPADKPPAAANGVATTASVPDVHPNGDAPDAPSGKAMSLREALAQKAAAPVVAEPTEEATPAPPVTAPVAEAIAPSVDEPEPPAEEAVSLREALAARSTAPVDSASVAAPSPTDTARLPVVAPVVAPAAPADPPADAPAGRAVSLREALGRTSDTAPPPPADRVGGNLASLRGTAPPPPFETDVWPGKPGKDGKDGKPKKDKKAGKAEKAEKADRKRRSLPRPSLSVPEMSAPPSKTIITIVCGAVAAIVLIAVVSVVLSRRPVHHAPAVGTAGSSLDACRVVGPDLATATFGHVAGPPHPVLGTCVYDDGTQELIVSVARQDARTLFNASRTSDAVNVPGVGEGAYYAKGKLWVLKQTSVMQLVLGPVPAATPAPALLTLAQAAVARL